MASPAPSPAPSPLPSQCDCPPCSSSHSLFSPWSSPSPSPSLFSSPPPSAFPTGLPPLLRIPFQIRMKIYDFLGFRRYGYQPLNGDPPDRRGVIGEWSHRHQRIRQRRPCLSQFGGCMCGQCYPLANQLFYVSRAISNDAQSVLYSQNHFFVSGQGLSQLKNMSNTAFRSLRLLVIDLGTTACRYTRHFGVEDCHGTLSDVKKTEKQRLLDNHSTLSDWRQICNRFAAHTMPDWLDLDLVCSATRMDTTKAILKPLLKMPQLLACSIRLGAYTDPSLQRLVEKTVRRATRAPARPVASFRQFSDLPAEIQIKILWVTDLVSPSRCLTWNSERKTFVESACMTGWCDAVVLQVREHPIRVCPATHVAYSSWHPTCWRLPTALFQTTRTLRAQAQYIFFSKNFFLVNVKWDNPRSPVSGVWEPERSAFLKPFPLYCIKHIRCLQWRFEEMDKRYFRPGQQMTADFTNAVNCIAQHATLSQLTLLLDLAKDEILIRFRDWDGVGERARTAQKWALCKRIVDIANPLSGLKDLFVHVSWPLSKEHRKTRDHREQKLEREVMGEQYDSVSRGKKPTRVKSLRDPPFCAPDYASNQEMDEESEWETEDE